MSALPVPAPCVASATELPHVWHAGQMTASGRDCLPTGEPALDAQLPGGGWPVGAMTEILQSAPGQHEWRVLLPALARGTGPLVLVGAPHAPFIPGLVAQGLDARRLLWVTADAAAQRLWVAEQALRCAEVAAVLAWLPEARAEQLRRLQIAAADHAKPLFVMRPASARVEPSPAALRVLVSGAASPGHDDALLLEVLKRRGPPLSRPLVLARRSAELATLLERRPRGDGVPAMPRAPEQVTHALGRTASLA